MSYIYEEIRPTLFTEEGVKDLMKIQRKVTQLLTNHNVMLAESTFSETADPWTAMACLDYMVEQKEIYEVTEGCGVAGQYRTYVRGAKWNYV